MTATVLRFLILISIDFLRFYFSIFSLVLVSIEKIYQTLKTVFNHISKHLLVRQKSTLVSVFGNVIKQDLSCLIYYFVAVIAGYLDLILCYAGGSVLLDMFNYT